MIKEFGIDPSVANSESAVERILRLFSLANYTYIRKYPNHWDVEVKRSLKREKPRAKLRAIENLKKLSTYLLNIEFAYNYNHYDNSLSWYQNTISFHSYHPFDGIVSSTNPDHKDFIFDFWDGSLDKFIEEFNGLVQRRADLISGSIKPLLLYSKEIHFVDPYFGRDQKERRYRPLIEFLKIVSSRCEIGRKSISRIVYHTVNEDTGLSDKFLRDKLNEKIAPILSDDLILEILRWNENELHNRYVLTDIGGVNFNIGLDDDDFNPDNEFDEIRPIRSRQCKTVKGRLESLEPFMCTSKPPSILIPGKLHQ